MKNVKIDEVHISTIGVGDTIEHEGKLMTVTATNIKRDGFMGTSLFGDSYKCGNKPVKKATFITKQS